VKSNSEKKTNGRQSGVLGDRGVLKHPDDQQDKTPGNVLKEEGISPTSHWKSESKEPTPKDHKAGISSRKTDYGTRSTGKRR